MLDALRVGLLRTSGRREAGREENGEVKNRIPIPDPEYALLYIEAVVTDP